MRSTPSDGARAFLPNSLRVLRPVVVTLLLVSAALTLIGVPELKEAVAAGRWPRVALALPPTFLALFIVGYGVYRFALVRAGRYPAGKALVQLGLMVLVLGVVASVALEHVPGAGERRDRLERALRAGDPEVRAMAAELVRYRPPEVARPLVPRLIELLGDPSPLVRREAHATLAALAGLDAGEGPDAAARWREVWRARGAEGH